MLRKGPGDASEQTYMAHLGFRTAQIGIQEADASGESAFLDLNDIHIGFTTALSPLVDRASLQENGENDCPAIIATPYVEILGEFLVIKRAGRHVVEQFGRFGCLGHVEVG
jgi:hypothetical protein